MLKIIIIIQFPLKFSNLCIHVSIHWTSPKHKKHKKYAYFSLEHPALYPKVCECQIHFARREEGNKTEMPHFAGQRGPEINRGMLEIEAVFDKNLNILRDVRKTILDVKATSWHDDYNRYTWQSFLSIEMLVFLQKHGNLEYLFSRFHSGVLLIACN